MANEWIWSTGPKIEGDFWLAAALDDDLLMIQMQGGPGGTQEVRMFLHEFESLAKKVAVRQRHKAELDATIDDMKRMERWRGSR